jgi:hypothetical protein
MNEHLINPPAIVRPVEDLATLASRIRAGHTAAEGAARSSLEHALQVGNDLIKAKALCGHGQWLKWLEANAAMTDRTARRYMRIARHWDKSDTVSDLTPTEILRQLSTPEEAGDEAEPATSLDEEYCRDDPEFAEAYRLTVLELAEASALLQSPDCTLEQCVGVIHTAKQVGTTWRAARVDAMSALGQVLERQRAQAATAS